MDQKVVPLQEEQFRRFVDDAARTALRMVNPDMDAMERLLLHREAFQDHIALGIRRFTAEDPTYEAVRAILGEDFISPEEVVRTRRGVLYSETQLRRFAETVPPVGVLTWCKENNYMLVPGPHRALSLLDQRDLEGRHFSESFGRIEAWAPRSVEPMFVDTVRTAWIALSKEPVADSFGRRYSEQLPLLSDEEAVPNAAEVAWCVATFREVRGIALLSNVLVRTSSTDKFGARVCLGEFGLRDFGSPSDGLRIYTWSDGFLNPTIGLSAKRR